MTIVMTWMLLLSALLPAQTPPEPQMMEPVGEVKLASLVRAEIRASRLVVPAGGEVMLEFVIQNKTAQPVTLRVPEAKAGRDATEMGLPLEHVFSGPNFRALEVTSEQNPTMGERMTLRPEYPVPVITLAPFGTVGLRFDVSKKFYPGLHQVGTYVLKWRPYGGALESNTVVIKVVEYKQVVMDTEFGQVTLGLLYDKAPKTVDNFLELVRTRFYNGKTFHMVRPNLFLQGGCPNGDGTGRRPDGATLAPEFNDVPFDVGTVAMALAEPDLNSASCQFFICLARQPKWDGRYTAFAQVEGPESLTVLRRLSEAETTGPPEYRPTKPLKIKSMSIQDVPFVGRSSQ